VVTEPVPVVPEVPIVAVSVAVPTRLLGVKVTVNEPPDPVVPEDAENVPVVDDSDTGIPASGLLSATLSESGAEPATKLVTLDGVKDTVVPLSIS
jgi:hypothetical protein